MFLALRRVDPISCLLSAVLGVKRVGVADVLSEREGRA